MSERVRRYTELPFLLDMLVHRGITLLSPSTWVDTNDSHFLTLYKQHSKLASVLALCFTRADETFHHWKIFSGTSSGVCIEFQSSFLLNVSEERDIRVVQMSYRNMDTLERNPPAIHHLPAIKRFAYREEREVRLLWESATEAVAAKRIPLNLRDVKAIHTSPWLSEPVHRAVKGVIHAIPGCSDLLIRRTTMLDSAVWRKYGQVGVNPLVDESARLAGSAAGGAVTLKVHQSELELRRTLVDHDDEPSASDEA